MEIYSTLASIFTVLSFLAFIGIVAWAYSSKRKRSFDEAANEPFTLPDETEARSAVAPGYAARERFDARANVRIARLRRDVSDGARR